MEERTPTIQESYEKEVQLESKVERLITKGTQWPKLRIMCVPHSN